VTNEQNQQIKKTLKPIMQLY